MPRPFKWAEYFNKDAALQNRSNKYQVSCIRCQKKIPKGRSEERTRHLVEECTGLTPQEREQIVRVEAKEAEAAAAGTSKPRGRPPGDAADGGFGDTEIEEFLKLVRPHHPLENDDRGWQVVFDDYNSWAEANGFKKRTGDALRKQWYILSTVTRAKKKNRKITHHGNRNLRVNNNRLHPTGTHPNFPWDVPEARVLPWELSGLDGFEDDPSGADTDHDALGDPNAADLGAVSTSGYSLPPPPRFDPELTSTLRGATPPPNLSPPQSASSGQQRQTQYRPTAYSRPPPITRRLQIQSGELENTPDRVPPASSSLIDFLEYENIQKAKRIEKLEARADKLEEKLDKLDSRNRKLEDQNRKLEQQNQMLKMQIMVGGGSVSTKRKRGNSELLLLQDVVDD